MANLLQLLPSVEEEELRYIKELSAGMTDSQIQQFAAIYSSRRKDPQTIMLLTLVGFLGIAGVQRFITDQMGLGILYLLTVGLCFVGTIIDLINYKKLTFEFNQKIARQVMSMTMNSI
jgi:TM2 domain-containing membrane protein YozV